MTRDVSTVLEQGIARGVTPGLAASFGKGHPISIQKQRWCFGQLGKEIQTPVSPETVYDLASLTKILSGTLLCAVAVAEKKLALDEEPWPFWPKVKVAHILKHTSGLPAWKPLYEHARSYQAVLEKAKTVQLVEPPGSKLVYSDIGFIVLAELLENRLGASLSDLFNAYSHRYYGDTGLRYVDLTQEKTHAFFKKAAPTEENPWSSAMSQGQVNDLNCFAMGGVSAHAGLFGNLLDVEKAAQFFLNALSGNESGVPAVLRDFAHDADPRPLGFDRPSKGGSTGNALSPQSVGHLGFTGTSLWIDPVAFDRQGAFYILLTNRIHQGPDMAEIQRLRVAFHEAASEWLARTPA